MITTIPLPQLALCLIFIAIVVAIQIAWSLEAKGVIYATARMLTQLTLIGFLLNFIFNAKSPIWVSVFLTFMILAASWIALRPLKQDRPRMYLHTLIAILIGGGFTLALVVFGILQLDPWYLPRYVIPLAGMILSNAMNSVSLAAERFDSERQRGASYVQARNTAFNTGLLPIMNAFFAVGLVSLPGMMTGQILAGISPFIAIRYQIMVMSMVFASAGISSAIFLHQQRKSFPTSS